MTNVLLPPYSSIPIPGYMRKELFRRQYNYGINPSTDTVKNDYAGQMTTWMRVASNGKSDTHNGFILKGGTSTEETYGIGKNLNTVIGMDYAGKPHIIKNELGVKQLHRPAPGIDSMDITIQKNIYRTAFIKWKCFSVEQLNYMTPYFMTPYTTVFLEWGWNNYNPASLVPLGDIGNEAEYDENGQFLTDWNGLTEGSGIKGFYTNPMLFEKSLEMSQGRYDGMIGHIINYDYTFNPSQMCFDCTTEIASNSRFYFGLSLSGFLQESEEKNQGVKEASTTKNAADYIREDIKAIITSCVSGETVVKSNNGAVVDSKMKEKFSKLIAGRVFSPQFYRNKIGESSTKTSVSNLYITFGCLADIINEVVRFGKSKFEIDIKNTKISAHPNIISCSDTFLVPNHAAPYFYSEILIDSNNTKRLPIVPEEPIFKSSTSNTSADKLLKNEFNVVARQDLNTIINYWRNSHSARLSEYSFPEMSDPYSGKLENIFLSFSFIEEQIKSTDDIRSFLKSICEMLNDNVPIWRLDVIDWNGKISIRDMNYYNKSDLEALKTQMGISSEENVIYSFNPFVQNSLLKEFSFNVKLSDAVANMVINQANNQMEPSSSGVFIPDRYSFPESRDLLLSSLNKDKFTKSSNTVDSNVSGNSWKKKSDPPQNIDEKAMAFTKTLDENRKQVSRLILPGDSGKAKLRQILNDESAAFSEYNTPPIPGVRVEFSLLGIAGFKTFQVIDVENLPKPYERGKVVFQIVDVKHSVTMEGWTTQVSSVIRPVKSLELIQK